MQNFKDLAQKLWICTPLPKTVIESGTAPFKIILLTDKQQIPNDCEATFSLVEHHPLPRSTVPVKS